MDMLGSTSAIAPAQNLEQGPSRIEGSSAAAYLLVVLDARHSSIAKVRSFPTKELVLANAPHELLPAILHVYEGYYNSIS